MVSDLGKSFKIFSHNNCMVGGLTNLSDTYKALYFFQLPNIPSLELSSTNIIVWGEEKKFPTKMYGFTQWLVGATKCKIN
jgi:hypothetical protein